MYTPLSLFCDECGAMLPAQVTHCPTCQWPVDTPVIYASQIVRPPPLALAPQMQPVHPGARLAQRYTILCEVGKGGFGVVYKAQDRYQRNRLVAVKQINLSALSAQEMIEVTDSYNREVTLLKQLKHDNLPCIYDHFTDPAHWYIVMNFIDGETLEDYLKKVRHGRLPVKKVIDIGIVLCDVLQYLHTRRPPVIFRDVKPGNIMYTRQGSLYLIDFGIARRYIMGKTRDTGPLGSPGYAAPEQYGRTQTTVQTDIYSLGATLQTLLTGREPFEIAADGKRQEYRRKLPKRLQLLLQQMMEQDAGNRPAHMEEVKLRLQKLKEDGPRLKKVKQTIGISWRVLKSSYLLSLLITGLLARPILTSPLWPTYLGVVACIVTGFLAYGLHHEIPLTSSKLSVRDMLSGAWDSLKYVPLFITFITVVYYLLYNSLDSIWIASYLLFSVIASGIGVIISIFWLVKLLIRLVRFLTHKQPKASLPPLQQFQRHP